MCDGGDPPGERRPVIVCTKDHSSRTGAQFEGSALRDTAPSSCRSLPSRRLDSCAPRLSRNRSGGFRETMVSRHDGGPGVGPQEPRDIGGGSAAGDYPWSVRGRPARAGLADFARARIIQARHHAERPVRIMTMHGSWTRSAKVSSRRKKCQQLPAELRALSAQQVLENFPPSSHHRWALHPEIRGGVEPPFHDGDC